MVSTRINIQKITTMYAHTWHECPHCGFEIECEFEINETDPEVPDDCPECGKPLNADPSKLVADAMGNLTDAAHDAAKE